MSKTTDATTNDLEDTNTCGGAATEPHFGELAQPSEPLTEPQFRRNALVIKRHEKIIPNYLYFMTSIKQNSTPVEERPEGNSAKREKQLQFGRRLEVAVLPFTLAKIS